MSAEIQAEQRQIVDALKTDPRRMVYEAGRTPGEYWVCCQGPGPFQRATIVAMLASGLLRRKYPDCECYALAELEDNP